MEKIFALIDRIIEDLVDQDANIESALLKTQVLASNLKNDKLKSWVNKELNGYEISDTIPNYRVIRTQVKGNLFQGLGFGGYQQLPDSVLPIEVLGEELSESLSKYQFTVRISHLQEFTKSKEGLHVELPYAFLILMSKQMHPWEVVKAWQAISPGAVSGVLSSIKSNLINFLLELKEKFGDEDIPLMDKKKEIDNLIEKNIGTISGENINISFGRESLQSINTGKKANIVQGEKNKLIISKKTYEDLADFISELKSYLENLSLEKDDNQDIMIELSRIEAQVAREKPKNEIINEALNIINGILIGVAGNAMTPIILEKLGWLISQFGG